MVVVVGLVAEVLGPGQTGDRDRVDGVDIRPGGLEHRGHERVVAAAVLDHEVGLRQFEAIPGGRFVGVRILIRIVDDRSHLGEVTGDLGDDVGVDIRRRHHRKLPGFRT